MKKNKFQEIERRVLEIHKNSIGPKGGTGRNAGYYRTKVIDDGVRKDLYGKDYEDIIYKLEEFYSNKINNTFKAIYDKFEASERLRGLDEKTLEEKRYKFNHMEDLWQLNIGGTAVFQP